MTFYSDLLIIIDEIDALKHGLTPRHSVAQLRRLCGNVLAVDPAEDLASQLLDDLRDLEGDLGGVGINIFLFDRFRVPTASSRGAH